MRKVEWKESKERRKLLVEEENVTGISEGIPRNKNSIQKNLLLFSFHGAKVKCGFSSISQNFVKIIHKFRKNTKIFLKN